MLDPPLSQNKPLETISESSDSLAAVYAGHPSPPITPSSSNVAEASAVSRQ